MSGNLIPDEMAQRTGRLINEAENVRAQAVDDLKTIYADLREELKSLGWRGAEVSEQVAAFKAAISEMRLDDEKKAKREAKGDLVSEYVNVLTVSRARARVRADRGVEVGVDTPVGPITGEILESGAATNGAFTSSDPHEADESGSPIHEPDATTSRQEPAVNPEPTFAARPKSLTKPLCRFPGEDRCAGYGSVTCHACLRAAREDEVAA